MMKYLLDNLWRSKETDLQDFPAPNTSDACQDTSVHETEIIPNRGDGYVIT